MKSLVPAVVVGLMLAASSASFAESTPEYHVTRTIALGTPDRWDYVIFDPASVVDPKTNAAVATIQGGGKLEYACRRAVSRPPSVHAP